MIAEIRTKIRPQRTQRSRKIKAAAMDHLRLRDGGSLRRDHLIGAPREFHDRPNGHVCAIVPDRRFVERHSQ
ncbi:MAG: hypothetical protein ACREPJ_04095 [Rhodanobacteraceae bacterium]